MQRDIQRETDLKKKLLEQKTELEIMEEKRIKEL